MLPTLTGWRGASAQPGVAVTPPRTPTLSASQAPNQHAVSDCRGLRRRRQPGRHLYRRPDRQIDFFRDECEGIARVCLSPPMTAVPDSRSGKRRISRVSCGQPAEALEWCFITGPPHDPCSEAVRKGFVSASSLFQRHRLSDRVRGQHVALPPRPTASNLRERPCSWFGRTARHLADKSPSRPTFKPLQPRT